MPTLKLTKSQLAKITGKRAPQKYKRSAPEERTWGGVTFDSKAEMVFQRMNPKAIHQPTTVILAGGIKYKPDFFVWDHTPLGHYVDVKGMRTAAYNLKLRLYASLPAGATPLHEVKAKYRRGVIVGFETTRIIVPGKPVPRVMKKKRTKGV